MTKKVISTDAAPKAIGAYSQAIEIDGFVFTSGQLPINPETGEMPQDDPAAQAKQSMENVKNILKAAGMDLSNVVKTVIFIADMNHFGKINEVYQSYFEGDYPARSCVQVARLPKDALVEIEVIAKK